MEKHISEYYKIIEEAIKRLGVDPIKARTKTGRWALLKGKHSVWVYVTPQKENLSQHYCQVSAPIMKTPTKDKGAFFQQLLKLNSQLLGAAFVEHLGVIYISAIRETNDISIRETILMINRVGAFSHFYHKHKQQGILDWPLYSPS